MTLGDLTDNLAVSPGDLARGVCGERRFLDETAFARVPQDGRVVRVRRVRQSRRDEGRETRDGERFAGPSVNLVLQSGVAAPISADDVRQFDRVAVRQVDPRPADEDALVGDGRLRTVGAEDAAATRDEQPGAGPRVVDVAADLGDGDARQFRADALQQDGRDDGTGREECRRSGVWSLDGAVVSVASSLTIGSRSTTGDAWSASSSFERCSSYAVVVRRSAVGSSRVSGRDGA